MLGERDARREEVLETTRGDWKSRIKKRMKEEIERLNIIEEEGDCVKEKLNNEGKIKT